MKKVLLWISLLSLLLYIILEYNDRPIRERLETELIKKGLPTPAYANTEELYKILNTK